jgi:ElaB/YqjD/DUF883 family membrane-anchored ribosome-binding protein
VPVTGAPADVAGLLPQHATEKPLGEWPAEAFHEHRADRTWESSDVFHTFIYKARPMVESLQEQLLDLRHRLRIVRGRIESGELQDELKDRASVIADEASRQARLARTRAEFYARNYPLQFIAGAAVAGFAIGFLLRMGRDE